MICSFCEWGYRLERNFFVQVLNNTVDQDVHGQVCRSNWTWDTPVLRPARRDRDLGIFIEATSIRTTRYTFWDRVHDRS